MSKSTVSGSSGNCMFSFMRNCLFFGVGFYSPTGNVLVIEFHHILTSIWGCCCFYFSHLDRYVVISHVVLICISLLLPCLFNLYTEYIMRNAGLEETLGWKKHKLESRLPGEISITSDMQMTPPLWQKVKRN